ncbi:MAG: fatty acid desaturase [Gemmatimonadetes bacterium]|nr:fatty acid desaturase [Gemmatimonadota bacterium]MBI3569053.1 fatty acid desaturase [Gemmatimonadota bacterium]
MAAPSFRWSDDREPHRARTQALLRAHPGLRSLVGRNPWTAVAILGTVALQGILAFEVRSAPWWAVLALAWCVGAFLDHALFVMVHECSHDLVLPRRWQNTSLAIVANLPQIFPSAVSFRHYHLKHHSYQGVTELDADLPAPWEARLVQNGTVRKALWLLFFPFFQIARAFRLREIRLLDPWVAGNWIAQLAFDAAVWSVLGPRAFAYLAASLCFSVGLHPLGARWIQEHFLTHGDQETSSYYGPLNAVALNVGYHNEHHDLPSVPWHRLPAIRRAAPEFYDTLRAHRSWSRLLVRFIADPELSLYSRVTRSNRGGAANTVGGA